MHYLHVNDVGNSDIGNFSVLGATNYMEILLLTNKKSPKYLEL